MNEFPHIPTRIAALFDQGVKLMLPANFYADYFYVEGDLIRDIDGNPITDGVAELLLDPTVVCWATSSTEFAEHTKAAQKLCFEKMEG